MENARGRRLHRWVIAVGLVVGAVLYSIGMWNAFMPVHRDFSMLPGTEAPKPKPTMTETASSMLFTGNVFWGRNINDWAMKSELKYAYPFARLGEFHREQYDAWISGLECPTADGVHMTAAEMEAQLQFNCDPAYLPEAAKWFTAFTLANNHTDNQGETGFAQTKAHLDAAGIQYFGHYDPARTEDACDVIAMPAKVTKSDNTTESVKLPMALCAYHGVFRIPSQESLAVMERYAAYMPVIAMPHMGVEYKPVPDQLKTDLYRSMIDHGADMVIGDHPHVTQTSESYKGHLIVYSMGNFMFDQQGNQDVTVSAAVRVDTRSKAANAAQLAAWTDLGKSCATYHDTCLAQAKAKRLTKLPLEYTFSIVASNDNNKQTKLGSAADLQYVLSRLHWNDTITKLAAPYRGK